VPIPGSHLDVYPTVAHLLGITPPQYVMGQDLLSTHAPTVTLRDPYADVITEILTPSLAYLGAPTGLFEDGSCFTMPHMLSVSREECQTLYDAQLTNLTVSDLIIHGNMLAKQW
jgi:lipoteichoic acid synthase